MSIDCVPYINDLQIEIGILKEVMKDKDDKNKKQIMEKITCKEKIIKNCIDNLKQLSNNQICYRIYVNMLSGLSVNKSIAKVAEENYLNNVKPASESMIFKKYYPELKKMLKL